MRHSHTGAIVGSAATRRKVESHLLDVVGVDQPEQVAAKDVIGLVTENLPHGRRLEPHVAVNGGNGDHVAGGLDQGLEALRALDLDGALLQVGPRDRQRDLRGQGPDRVGQLVRDRLGRFHDQHAADRVLDADARQQHLAVAERARLSETG